MKKAIILLSGGLDSATTLAIAQHQGYECIALSFNYGQRHSVELVAAKKLTQQFSVFDHRVITIDLGSFGGSALTDMAIDVPETATQEVSQDIPVTYVPARNTVFLSYALALAEVVKSDDVFIGVNAVDYSGYPDCRPEFIRAYEVMANFATRAGVEGHHLNIHTPLIDLSKAEIIQQGIDLGMDYSTTVSCYQASPDGAACGRCESCQIRASGFKQAGVPDPTLYQ